MGNGEDSFECSGVYTSKLGSVDDFQLNSDKTLVAIGCTTYEGSTWLGGVEVLALPDPTKFVHRDPQSLYPYGDYSLCLSVCCQRMKFFCII